MTTDRPPVPRWIHWCAVLSACAALPLLIQGARVTTLNVPLVDPKGFRWPWEIFAALTDAEYRVYHGLEEALSFGLVIELTHRLLAFLVGVLAIVLCVGLLLRGRGRLRWLGVAVLAAVVAQGLLGRYRVDLGVRFGRGSSIANTLAQVHGAFAQLVFALLVSAVLWTSRLWAARPRETASPAANRFRRWSLLTAALVFGQGVLGGLVRHQEDLAFGARAHLLGAFVVVAAVAWLVRLALDVPEREKQGTRAAGLVAGLVVLQLVLGVETWLSKFEVVGQMRGRVEPLLEAEVVRSAHYLVGALTFAAAVATALLANRQPSRAPASAPVPVGQLEGAAS